MYITNIMNKSHLTFRSLSNGRGSSLPSSDKGQSWPDYTTFTAFINASVDILSLF